MLSETSTWNPGADDDSEEEVDVEEAISKVEDECLAFINPNTQERFDEIFDTARKTYADPGVQGDWDGLFENLNSELTVAADEEEAESILDNYVKKAKGLG